MDIEFSSAKNKSQVGFKTNYAKNSFMYSWRERFEKQGYVKYFWENYYINFQDQGSNYRDSSRSLLVLFIVFVSWLIIFSLSYTAPFLEMFLNKPCYINFQGKFQTSCTKKKVNNLHNKFLLLSSYSRYLTEELF